MTSRKDQLLNSLRQNSDEVTDFFESIEKDDWDQEVYMDGAYWSVREVLCHYAQVERWYCDYIRKTLSGKSTDGDSYVLDQAHVTDLRGCDYESMGPKELIEEFKDARADILKLTESLSEKDLDHEVNYQLLADIGVDNQVEEMLRHLLRHMERHQADVTVALQNSEANAG